MKETSFKIKKYRSLSKENGIHYILNETGYVFIQMVLSQTRMEMLEQKFTENGSCFVS
jgi:hypothetical protein